MLQREGMAVNHKRVYRLYKLENMALRRKTRKKVSRPRVAMPMPTGPNERWSMDFLCDQLADGRRFRILEIMDEFNRENLALEPATSFPGSQVVLTLERIAAERGLPKSIVMDNGPEFVGRALDTWAHKNKVKLDFIQPGKPMQNGFSESFNGKFRDECLSQNWFMTMHEARAIINLWRTDYNTRRPHSSLGKRTPSEFMFEWSKNQIEKGSTANLGL